MKKHILILLFALCATFPTLQAQDDDAAMAAYVAAMTPGADHEWMAGMAGDFNYLQRTYMDPTQPPIETKGTSHGEMVLGDRYLEETTTGTLWDMPFEGHNTLAYDNVTNTYQMSWIDNMGTGIMTGSGTRKGNVLTIICPSTDPITKKPMSYRCVTTFQSANTHLYEMYEVKKKGKEVKFMDIQYTRK